MQCSPGVDGGKECIYCWKELDQLFSPHELNHMVTSFFWVVTTEVHIIKPSPKVLTVKTEI